MRVNLCISVSSTDGRLFFFNFRYRISILNTIPFILRNMVNNRINTDNSDLSNQETPFAYYKKNGKKMVITKEFNIEV